MKISSTEITFIYAQNNQWFYKGTYNNITTMTTNLLNRICSCDEFGVYNITINDYFTIMNKLTKRFSYNVEER